jgi:hypothetical protein
VKRFPLVRQAAPGALLALALWLITIVRWQAGDYVSQEMDALWQSAGRENLTNDPFGTLSVLHIQPPGMNALFALDLAVTPTSHAFLLGMNLLAMLAAIVVIVDTLRRFGASAWLSMSAGIAYALLPSTVIYSQWAYSVSLIAFFSVAAVWGISFMRTHAAVGAIVSTSAIALAALTRPSYTTVLVVVWLVGVAVLLFRSASPRRWVGLGGLAAVAVAVAAVQLHYLVSFGLPTMSSWSGENLAKALSTSQSLTITDGARREIESDLCRSQMLEAYERDELNRWDWRAFRDLPACAELSGLPTRGVAAWDGPTKGASGQENFVYSERLVASREWTRMMTTIVRNDPWQLVRMATTTDFGPRNSGLGLYLSPAEDYPFVKDIRDAHPLAVPLGLWSLLFPAFAWTLVIVGVVLAITRRNSPLRSAVFGAGVFLATYHLAVNVLFEYSENMRYRAEIDSVLMVLAAIVISSVVRTEAR